jgi:hypothetical protein
MGMSKRLQVLFDDKEYQRIQRLARLRGMTTSDWVREATRRAAEQEPQIDRGKKLGAIRAAAAHAFPTANIDEMLNEIDRGRDLGLDE